MTTMAGEFRLTLYDYQVQPLEMSPHRITNNTNIIFLFLVKIISIDLTVYFLR